MSKFNDYDVKEDVNEIMEKMVETFPKVFNDFESKQIFCVHTRDKYDSKKPIRIRSVKYPFDTLIDRTYIFEVADGTWNEMDNKRKNLAVFHAMCSIPEGAFDAESKNYAKIKKPDYEIYAEEFAVSGGIPNWMENDEAKDPIENIERNPVTIDGIANVGE